MTQSIEVHHSKIVDFTVAGLLKFTRKEGVTYIGQYAWTEDQTWTMFYQEEPKEEGHHNLFALRSAIDPYEMMSGKPLAQMKTHMRVTGLDDRRPLLHNGLYSKARNAFVYSRYTHDFFQTPFGFAIDGGGDYARIVGDKADFYPANFDPMAMKIEQDGQVYKAEYAAADLRELRGDKVW